MTNRTKMDDHELCLFLWSKPKKTKRQEVVEKDASERLEMLKLQRAVARIDVEHFVRVFEANKDEENKQAALSLLRALNLNSWDLYNDEVKLE